MKITKEILKDMIAEEIKKTNLAQPIKEEVDQRDPAQSYIDWIVAIQQAATEALELVEGGTEPYEAAFNSRLNQLAFGLTGEDFYHHYFG